MQASSSTALLLLGLTFGRGLLAQEVRCPPPDSLAGAGAVLGRALDARTQVALGYSHIWIQVSGAEAPLAARADPAGWFRFCSVPSGSLIVRGQFGILRGLLGPLTLDPGQTLSVSLGLAQEAAGNDTGTLTGTVVDRGTGDPVDGATVELPGLGQRAASNPLGKFTLPSLPPGKVAIRVSRMGYADAAGEVEIQAGRIVSTEVALAVEPIALEPIKVTAVRRRMELPGLEDFERRYNSGWGRFILEEEIQRRSPRKLTDVLWETGVEVIGDGKEIRIRRTMCAPLVYLDGVKLTHLSRAGGPKPGGYLGAMKNPWPQPDAGPTFEAADAVNLVHPSEVAAVEVYRGPAETPGKYIDSNSRCGVILIWTRRGSFAWR